MKFIPLLPLSSCHVAMVDDADYARVVAAGPWYVQRAKHTIYAQHYVGRTKPGGKYQQQSLHRFIMDVKPGDKTQIDHKNGIGFDCQRENLRCASSSQNHGNTAKRKGTTSIYKGVNWDKSRKKWLASICYEGKRRNLGRFTDEKDAAAAYQKAAKEAFGVFARAIKKKARR